MTRPSPPPPPLVELLSKPDCHLCEDVKVLLRNLQAVYAFTLREIDIAHEAELCMQYGEEIPVVFINGRKAFKYRVDPKKFVRRLQRARDRHRLSLWRRLRQRGAHRKGLRTDKSTTQR